MKKSPDGIYLTKFNILLFYRLYKLCKLCRKFQSARKILSKNKVRVAHSTGNSH